MPHDARYATSYTLGETSEELRSRFNKHRYDAKERPGNCDLAEDVYNKQQYVDKDIEIFILKQGFKSAEERRFSEDKFICAFGSYTPDGLNKKRGNYVKEMYSFHQELHY